ncbi:hypothetical protein [uncultured Ruegeria sp.]|uniref:hypothetical protein n=1 Tax=uncultured Ruegeria sp. TaxID=259304 RepID=UPI0026024D21|nr:hypothetical protein [uncultured Ruegeria sp.]
MSDVSAGVFRRLSGLYHPELGGTDPGSGLIGNGGWTLPVSITAVRMKTSHKRIQDVGRQANILNASEAAFIAAFVLAGAHLFGKRVTEIPNLSA